MVDLVRSGRTPEELESGGVLELTAQTGLPC